MTGRYLIKGGRVIDPANKTDEALDIFISDGKVHEIGRNLKANGAEIVDASRKIVAPGFVDMHTHLREPGREDKETIATGTRAAIRGGFTSVACMPNTEPAIDSPEAVADLQAIIKRDALTNVFIIGAITESRAGAKLTDFKSMRREGVVAVSDDGSSVGREELMVSALKEAAKNSIILIEHCEDAALSAGGVINKGIISTKMGLRGIACESEYGRVERNVSFAGKTSLSIHIAHVSCKKSVDIIREAKKDGVKVTAETAPHYFALTEDCCTTYDTNTKMNPPLRTKSDAEAIKKALFEGTIDCIATDHAPHTDAEKDVEFDYAPFGIIGLETALGLSVTELVEKNVLSWAQLIMKMSVNPSAILGIDRGNLKKGKIADIVIIDPQKEFVYEKDSIESMSKNSPFIGWKLRGRVTDVMVAGKIAMRQEEIFER